MMPEARTRHFIRTAGRMLISGLGICLVIFLYLIVLTRGKIL
jgi:hypothetical protein